ncbi:exo-alpha-sialidase [Gaoshiqia sp. Z1-71]|uniref:exo-alpha-sialidase n=1 Tax=Gaoshiqia hydrogeniformans TaxID=3290090 RepID=UPI003BF77A59
MNIRLIPFITAFVWVAISPLHACTNSDNVTAVVPTEKTISAKISNLQKQIPVLTQKAGCTVLQIRVQVEKPLAFTIEKVKIDLGGTTDINDIQSIKLVYTGEGPSSTQRQFGETSMPASSVVFSDKLLVSKPTACFELFVQLKDHINLLHRVNASCISIETDAGVIDKIEKSEAKGLRVGTALRQHMDDNVHTYRIPGLTTTNNGTLLAIYDVRRESARDLQGNMDIGMNRSTDGGTTWEPLQIVLDRGTWGGLPQKFNGISDACILVDENTNDIFVAGLWMHAVLDSNGKWIEGLTENSTNWQHQWSGKGSQPGFDEKQTCQFLITKSVDDGKTWSQPLNLTRMCKKEEWWLWAPAPGHGITLKDGTLVFPTQGRDASGKSFSNITWSKDGGQTWHTSNPASTGTTENMIVQLNDGFIMLNARDGKNKGNLSSTNGRVISITNDLGESWAVHPTSRGALIEPACMASLHKHEYTENGQKKSILLFSNPNSKTDRNNMTIKVSFDDGATWPEEHWILLDEGKGRGYSCLTSIDEQTIGILYEGSQADMVFQKIGLNELIGK